MALGPLPRFLASMRGQVVALLRRGPRTVDELADTLGLTPNGVRAHLAPLESDGLVRRAGVRRGPGAGKPAQLYEVPREAEALFSRAYVPMLNGLLEELAAQVPPARRDALLASVGRRLAAAMPRPSSASRSAKLQAAVALLNELGGDAQVEERGGVAVIRGHGCPLGEAVARRPEVCRAVQALLSEVIGAELRQCCQHGERPSCCFEVQ
ncbi:MAG TPA: helix-turn-helix domain-containing protein [Gemmatimonadales bacterium]|nr:helix-turn-helix domain-containing protein [Gemmatimonadales bacterium]